MSTRVVATDFGGPEVLSVVERTLPDPGPGEVRIRVRAAAVNPWDHKQYSGLMGSDVSALPMPLGLEAAGEVVDVGADAVGPTGPISVGDAVIVNVGTGAYASELNVPAASVYAKPDRLGWAEASGLLVTGSTAAHLLAATSVASGDTLLIHGASGSVGLAATQLARRRGARVIGTASERNHNTLSELGAVPVAYGAGLEDRVRALAPDGVDAAIDTIGTDEAIDASLKLVPDTQRVASVVAFHRAGDGIRLLGSGPGADPGEQVRARAKLDLLDDAETGTYRVVLGPSYPLADAARAHRLSISGHPGGKVVLVP
ncbi:MAG: quinone oxidoreductase family protein [Nocardioidaceae bacterium]